MIEIDTRPLEKQIRKIIKGLRDLEKNDAKKIMRQATRAGAKVILPVARSLVPKRTGFLASQIKVRSLARSRRWLGTTVREGKAAKPPKPPKPAKALSFSGDLEKDLKAAERREKRQAKLVKKHGKYNSAFYFSFVELGFKHRGGKKIKGQHFMQRAFKQAKAGALEASIATARDGMQKALEKTK